MIKSRPGANAGYSPLSSTTPTPMLLCLLTDGIHSLLPCLSSDSQLPDCPATLDSLPLLESTRIVICLPDIPPLVVGIWPSFSDMPPLSFPPMGQLVPASRPASTSTMSGRLLVIAISWGNLSCLSRSASILQSLAVARTPCC